MSSQSPAPLVWRWNKFSTADYVVTLTGGALTLGMAIVEPRPSGLFYRGVAFDEPVRQAFRADTLSGRYRFRDASDIGLSLTVMWPLAADALTAAWWYRGSREVAQEMALIDLQTFAISGALQGVTNVLVGRERPYVPDCGGEQLPEDALDCTGSIRNRSFFSGHASFAFTGAALVCSHHFKQQLLGAPWDAISCGVAYGVATTTAAFRIVSDVHYASDTMIGAVLGTVVGYGVPWLHYRQPLSDTRLGRRSPGFELDLTPTPGGLGIAGKF